MTRQLRLLRAHGIIQKVAKVTTRGRDLIGALTMTRAAPSKKLQSQGDAA